MAGGSYANASDRSQQQQQQYQQQQQQQQQPVVTAAGISPPTALAGQQQGLGLYGASRADDSVGRSVQRSASGSRNLASRTCTPNCPVYIVGSQSPIECDHGFSGASGASHWRHRQHAQTANSHHSNNNNNNNTSGNSTPIMLNVDAPPQVLTASTLRPHPQMQRHSSFNSSSRNLSAAIISKAAEKRSISHSNNNNNYNYNYDDNGNSNGNNNGNNNDNDGDDVRNGEDHSDIEHSDSNSGSKRRRRTIVELSISEQNSVSSSETGSVEISAPSQREFTAIVAAAYAAAGLDSNGTSSSLSDIDPPPFDSNDLFSDNIGSVTTISQFTDNQSHQIINEEEYINQSENVQINSNINENDNDSENDNNDNNTITTFAITSSKDELADNNNSTVEYDENDQSESEDENANINTNTNTNTNTNEDEDENENENDDEDEEYELVEEAQSEEAIYEEYCEDDYVKAADDEDEDGDEEEEDGGGDENDGLNDDDYDEYYEEEEEEDEDDDIVEGVDPEICRLIGREDALTLASCTPEQRAELERVQRLFPGLDEQFILLGKLGEGTFSTVYRAVDIRHNEYEQTEWQKPGQSPRYVAVKNVFAMSSPQRIANEIRIVKQLGQHEGIVSLITALRHQDHVIIVLPLLEYDDFRHYYNCMSVQDLQNYFRSLFSAVAHCHKFGVMHRDIKPSNFLYSVRQGRGVLVDFGLAETVDDMDRDIAATERSQLRQLSLANTQHASTIGRSSAHSRTILLRRAIRQLDGPTNARFFSATDEHGNPGVPAEDLRPAFHANRAGTRGFRPPEVLLKVPRQSPLIDVWAVGVTLLVFMTKRFPFFNSYDDQEALLELAVLFGTDEIQDVARFHGRLFYSNVPTLRPKRTDFRKIVLAYNSRDYSDFPPELFDLLSKCMELRTDRRISAAQALEHPFLR